MKKRVAYLIVLLVAVLSAMYIIPDNLKRLQAYSVDVYTINFNYEGYTITGYDKLYFRNGSDKLYAQNDNGSLLEESIPPVCDYEIEGYEIDFLGWFTDSGEQIIRYNSSGYESGKKFEILPSTSYTNIYGYWQVGEDVTLYPEFSTIIKPSRVEFITRLSQVAIKGCTQLYIGYNSSEFCTDNGMLNYVTEENFPTATKTDIGYTYTFLGWYIQEGNLDSIKIIDSDNSIIKGIEGYTDSDGRWIHIGNIILYPGFMQKENVYKITLSANSDSVIIGTDEIYTGYQLDKLYSDENLTTVISEIAQSEQTIKGYDSIFDGWYSSAGKCVIDIKGNLMKSVSGYTDGNGKWTLCEDCTLYAHFETIPHVIEINFYTDDPDIIMTGVKKLYSHYESNLFYTDENLTMTAGIPVVKKQKIGYTFEIIGWETDDKLVLTQSGTLIPSVEGITDESGRFIVDGIIYLKAKINEIPDQFTITFVANSIGETVYGYSKLYIGYEQNTFYSDKLNESIAQIPYAQKVVAGFKYSFAGWYDSPYNNAKQIITPDNTIPDSNIFKEGKYVLLSSVTLYAKFIEEPAVIEITLDAMEGELETEKIYIRYGYSEFYPDEDCMNPIRLPIPEYTLYGYDVTFSGYYISQGLTIKVINSDGRLEKDITNITGLNGEWICSDDITLYAGYKISPKVSAVTFGYYTGSDLIVFSTLYIGYKTDIFYIDSERTTPIQIPEKSDYFNGYTTTFNGYYTNFTNGKLIIDSGKKLLSDISEYTDTNSLWISLEDRILYADIKYEPNTYKISFLETDNFNGMVTMSEDLKELYVKYNTFEFYLESELITIVTKFPIATKVADIYSYTFYGWCINESGNYRKIIDEYGNICRISGYTYNEAGGYSAYMISDDITLVPCFIQNEIPLVINFITGEDENFTGNKIYYTRYGDTELYIDEECKIPLQRFQYPQSSKSLTGYTVTFMGWYSAIGNGILVIGPDGQIVQNAESMVNGFRWEFVGSINLYSQFSVTANLYKITFHAQDSVMELSKSDTLVLYVEYGGNALYTQPNKLYTTSVPIPEKMLTGYSSIFNGWLDEDKTMVLYPEDKWFEKSFGRYTDGDGNWKLTSDVIFEAKFTDTALIFKITLIIEDCEITNNITELYVRYDDKNTYKDSLCKQRTTFPVAKKEVDGYEVNFIGWYDDSQDQTYVVDGDGNIINGTRYYYEGWRLTENLVLIPSFTQLRQVYKVTFDNSIYSEGQKFTAYIQFNTNKFYKDELLTEQITQLEIYVYKKGYTADLTGWYTEQGEKVLTSNLIFTNESGYSVNGNYYYAKDIVLYSHIEFIPKVFKITLDAGEGEIVGTGRSTIEYYIRYGTDIFSLTNSFEESDILTQVKDSVLTKKGYIVTFTGYSYQGEMIISDGYIIENSYMEYQALYLLESDIVLVAEYEMQAKIYSVTFNGGEGIIQGNNSTFYIEFGTNKFYIDSELTTGAFPPYAITDDSEKIFSGYYTINGKWVIDENLNFVYTNDNGIIKKGETLVWGIDEDVNLYAEYKNTEGVYAINLIISGMEFSEYYHNDIVYVEIGNGNLYYDKFKNLPVNSEDNRYILICFDEQHYDFEFYGYYTQENGNGHLIIDKYGKLVNETVAEYLDNGIWIKDSETNLYPYYIVTAKEFIITLDSSGGEISGDESQYKIRYNSPEIYTMAGDITDLPKSAKYLEGYKVTFVGYETEEGYRVVQINDEGLVVIAGVAGYTDISGNWIISGDITLYAVYEEVMYTYDVTYYNYDGTIFCVIDLELNDVIILPDTDPVKVLDGNKEYVFRYWIGYNYNSSTIIKEDKFYYPYFEEFDKKIVENGTTLVNVDNEDGNTRAKIYLKNIDTSMGLVINTTGYTVTIEHSTIMDLVNNYILTSNSYGETLYIDVLQTEYQASAEMLEFISGEKYYSVQMSIDGLDTNIPTGKIYLSIKYTQSDTGVIRAYTINQKSGTKSQTDCVYDETTGIAKVTLMGVNSSTIMLCNFDEEGYNLQQENKTKAIKKILFIVAVVIGSILGVVLFVIIIKKIISSVKLAKWKRAKGKTDRVRIKEEISQDQKQRRRQEKDLIKQEKEERARQKRKAKNDKYRTKR